MTQSAAIGDNPVLLKSNYYMGIDQGGYDGNTFAVCVMAVSGKVVYVKQTHSRKVYEQEVARLKKYYDIPDWAILKEINDGKA